MLEEADPIDGAFTLEVSSPGLERALRTPGHFSRFVGTTVSVKTHPGTTAERRIEGRLTSADPDEDGAITVDGTEIPYAAIERARTVFIWGPQTRPGSKPGTGPSKSAAKRAAKAAASAASDRGPDDRVTNDDDTDLDTDLDAVFADDDAFEDDDVFDGEDEFEEDESDDDEFDGEDESDDDFASDEDGEHDCSTEIEAAREGDSDDFTAAPDKQTPALAGVDHDEE